MKKLLVIGAVAFFAGMNAQEIETVGFNMGDTFITGAAGFNSKTESASKTNTFTVAPSVGYFVNPNIAVGARIGYGHSKTTMELTNVKNEDKVETFSAGAFGRYYVTPASRFSFFGELNANYASLKSTETIGNLDNTNKADGFNFQFAPGINYFLSNNFAIEATWGVLGYSSVTPDLDGAESTENFNVGLDLNDLSLGLVYKF
jgi:outer membrane protein